MPLMVYPSRLVSRWRDGAARPSDDNISSALQFKVHLGTSFVVAPAQSAGYRTVRERPLMPRSAGVTPSRSQLDDRWWDGCLLHSSGGWTPH